MLSVSTLFCCVDSNTMRETEESLWEEIIFLVDSEENDDDDDIISSVKDIVKAAEISYDTERENITWVFKCVLQASTYEITKLSAGYEIFSRFLTKEQVNALQIRDLHSAHQG